ncbi:hypothetical protein DFH07DRAFT_1000760 [Mycena maculata]|uniref:Uncharacterized protein n=1 Tax=Mycena maculata TaxID=230809 RepID=A0AAD7HST2_9AGAR|nr:hypothetical protein DFH07DRAFT_1000760 [Mycena maculata]
MRDFPQEVIDLVLDHVSRQDPEDPEEDEWDSAPDPSIALCGLVCKRWLPCSRFHLFYSASLDGFRLRSLLDILDVSSFQPFSFIRRLTLDFYELLPFEPEHMSRLRDCLNLAWLRLWTSQESDIWLRLFLEAHLPFIGVNCPSLSRLELCSRAETLSVRFLADILTCLPFLEVFTLDASTSTIIYEDVPASHLFPARLHTLDINVMGVSVEPLFAWFLSLDAPPRLTSLTLFDIGPVTRSLLAYSQSAGSEFKFLSLGPSGRILEGPLGILKHATLLQHLDLYRQPISEVPNILSTLPSSHLRTVIICVQPVGFSRIHFDSVPYALIDEALADPRFRSLEMFSLEEYLFIDDTNVSMISPQAKALMPLAAARGILYWYALLLSRIMHTKTEPNIARLRKLTGQFGKRPRGYPSWRVPFSAKAGWNPSGCSVGRTPGPRLPVAVHKIMDYKVAARGDKSQQILILDPGLRLEDIPLWNEILNVGTTRPSHQSELTRPAVSLLALLQILDNSGDKGTDAAVEFSERQRRGECIIASSKTEIKGKDIDKERGDPTGKLIELCFALGRCRPSLPRRLYPLIRYCYGAGLGSFSSNGARPPNGARRLPSLVLPPSAHAADASNYPPERDETRAEYEERLTHVSRKAPLREACLRLSIKIPNSANLERLREELADHWFPLATAAPSTRPARQPSRSKAPAVTAHDVLKSAISLDNGAIHLAVPLGQLAPSRPTVQNRGEIRGGVPLVIQSTSGPSSLAPLARRLVSTNGQSRTSPAPSQLQPQIEAGSSSLAATPTPAALRHLPAPPVLLPSAIPRTPDRSGDPGAGFDSPVLYIPPIQEGDDDDTDAALLRQYDAEGANTYEMLSYEDEDEGDEGENGSDEEDADVDDPPDRATLLSNVRVAAVKRVENNRRAGGRKTQRAMRREWREFVDKAIAASKIPDEIVDEISLLLFIEFSAERPKRTRKGEDIPGTKVGASQLKKLFFGALRIRKEQDALDPSLAHIRPATSVIVYDSIKCRMDEALERERSGLVGPDEDAPDIRANTFLSEVTEEQLKIIGLGFLSHRQLRLCLWGHLAWTAQHASGNRGDDFRALKLAELQPHTMLHPDKRTSIYSVINPVYSVFISNLKPEMCPLGAFAFYFHYIYDEKNIIETMKIDWTLNKSWRAIRLLHGPKSPTTPFNEQNLYNLYCKSYNSAGFKSRLKAHLPRHLLGYKQEALGVDPLETSKLGWAILGAAGYQVDEPYDPIWRHVRVPEAFLQLICPMAEEIYASVAGKENLSGEANHWLMVMELREYFFQCGAAIWQIHPDSALFRLPAFQVQDVRNWMSNGYPPALSVLQAAVGSPVDLQRIQHAATVAALQEMRDMLGRQNILIRQLNDTVNRRTAVFTPARGFSASAYHQNGRVTGIIHPILGMHSARWLEHVFPEIKQPQLCWDVWGPSKTLDQFTDLQEIWNLYAVGEQMSTEDRSQTRTKPPLKLVEQYFHHRWRTSSNKTERDKRGKAWSRFREIPDWIDLETTTRFVSLDTVMAELEAMRTRDDVAARAGRPSVASTGTDMENGSGNSKKRAAAVAPRRPGAVKRAKTARHWGSRRCNQHTKVSRAVSCACFASKLDEPEDDLNLYHDLRDVEFAPSAKDWSTPLAYHVERVPLTKFGATTSRIISPVDEKRGHHRSVIGKQRPIIREKLQRDRMFAPRS